MVKNLSAKRAQTRQRLIDAAGEAILAKGFRDTTLDEIAARAGLTKGAIYDNFKSKDELFLAVMACNPSRLPLPNDASAPPHDKFMAMAAEVTSNDEAKRLQIPLRAEFLLYSLSHPEMRGQMAAWLETGFAAEADGVRATFSPKELGMSPEAFVVMLQAMIPGLMFLRSQAPGLVNDKVVQEIFEALARAKD